MSKKLLISTWIIIITAFLLMALIIFWLLFPYKVTEFKTQPFPIQNKVVRSGDHVLYEVDYCKNMSLSARISRSFEDGLIYTAPDIDNDAGAGCHKKLISVYVPRALPPGIYNIKNTYIYQVNPIRTVEATAITEKFEVIRD